MRWIGQLSLGTTLLSAFWMSARRCWAHSLIGSEMTWYSPGMSDIGAVLFQVAVWIAVAFFAVYRFFAYIDRRIRLEGWELESASQRVGLAPRGQSRLVTRETRGLKLE